MRKFFHIRLFIHTPVQRVFNLLRKYVFFAVIRRGDGFENLVRVIGNHEFYIFFALLLKQLVKLLKIL